MRALAWNSLRSLAFTSLLASCSSSGLFGDLSSQYNSYVSARVVESKIYKKGRTVLTVKALPGNRELFDKQNVFTPSHAFDYRADRTQAIVAISMPSQDVFVAEDFKFFLGDEASIKSTEILSLADIENHYPFAYPFLRVFVIDFDRGNEGEKILRVHSPVGATFVSLNYAPAAAQTAANESAP